MRAELPDGWAPFPGGENGALQQALERCVATLDYHDLNEHLPIPTEENLARWVGECLEVPGIESVGIQSTRDQGADLDPSEHVQVWRRFRFEAAHRLPNVPEGHQCGRMQGHGFEVILHADQDLGSGDMGVDFDHLGAAWAPLHAQLHYACLNDMAGLENPTSEMLSAWLWLPFFLILDCIEDPRNFGAILRVADAAGIHGIVVQSHRAATPSAEVAKVSAGALEYVPVAVVTNIKNAIRQMKEKGIVIMGADAGARQTIWDIDLSMPLALVVGSEGKALRQTVSNLCDVLISIPMFGRINSLNVSVAASICSFEILRQRDQKRKKFKDISR